MWEQRIAWERRQIMHYKHAVYLHSAEIKYTLVAFSKYPAILRFALRLRLAVTWQQQYLHSHTQYLLAHSNRSAVCLNVLWSNVVVLIHFVPFRLTLLSFVVIHVTLMFPFMFLKPRRSSTLTCNMASDNLSRCMPDNHVCVSVHCSSPAKKRTRNF